MYNPDSEVLKSLFITAFRAALKAGNKVLEIMNSDYEISMKSDNSPVSSADIAAEKIIKSYLIPTRIPILSEEGRDLQYEERKSWDILWIVDPLDGTRQFIEKRHEFTINIALIVDNYPMFGVIYAPAFKTIYFGHVKNGSCKMQISNEEEALEYSFEDVFRSSIKMPSDSRERDFKILLSKNHANNSETEAFIKNIQKTHKNVEIEKIGSSLKMCILADGSADVYPRYTPTYEWDTAAAQAVLEGAKYSIKSLETNIRLSYNKESLINPIFICEKDI